MAPFRKIGRPAGVHVRLNDRRSGLEVIDGHLRLGLQPFPQRSRPWENLRVGVKARAVAALVPLGIAVVAMALTAFAARTIGPPYFGTEPVVVASLGVGALATAAIGHATWRNDRAVGLTIVLGAWSLVAYLVVLGLASLTHATLGRGLIASTVARLAVGGHIPPLTLFVMTGVLARRSLLAERVIGWPLLVAASLAVVLFAASFTLAHPGAPFADVPPMVEVPPDPTAFEYVLVGRADALRRDFAVMTEDLRSALDKLAKSPRRSA